MQIDFLVGDCCYCKMSVWSFLPHGIRIVKRDDDLFARLLHEECIISDSLKECHVPQPPDAAPPHPEEPRRPE